MRDNRRSSQRVSAIDLSGRVPQHRLGMIEIDSVQYPLLRVGAWSSSFAYVPGNLVSDGGSDYVCVRANPEPLGGPQEPPNPTYWEPLDETQLFLDSRRVWSKPPQRPPLAYLAAQIEHGTIVTDDPATTIDWSGDLTSVYTNDGGYPVGTAVTSPFTGAYFKFDFGTDPTKLFIIADGVYLIRVFWWITTVAGTPPAGLTLFAMLGQLTGSAPVSAHNYWSLSNDTVGFEKIVGNCSTTGVGKFSTEWKAQDEKMLILDEVVTPADVIASIALAGCWANATDGFVGVAIVRLGDLTVL